MQNQKSAAYRYPRLRFLPTPRDRLVLQAVRTHGRLTAEQLQRLFFRHPSGRLVSRQAVNARLHRLTSLKLLESVVVNGGHGAGPYAYGLGPAGRQLLTRMSRTPRGHSVGAVWHLLEVAEFRVRLQEELTRGGGELAEWVGEAALRGFLVGRRQWPVADALVHWRLSGREGTFLLEWDRGTETLAILTSKLFRYLDFWQVRGHRELLPGLGLKPRLLLVVASSERASRIAEWLVRQNRERLSGTVLVGVARSVLRDPLGKVWWRSDLRRPGEIGKE
jgi:hypothetical protein